MKTDRPSALLHFAKEMRHNPTDAEALMWSKLRNRQLGGFKFRRQHPFEYYILDFYCEKLKLAIELDGGQHNTVEGKLKDQERMLYLSNQGIHVIRFWNHDVFTQTAAVFEKIWDGIETLQSNHPHPGPLPEGEGANHTDGTHT